MTTSYDMLPLGPREIRVLDVLTQKMGSKTNPAHQCSVVGNLRVVNLDDNPSFCALSYVWGTFSTPRHTVVCQGSSCTIEITTNCWSALRNLSFTFGALTIWVDAVCINQEAQEEKLSQIPLMQDIYSRATVVYLYLGDNISQIDDAIESLRTQGYQDLLRIDSGDPDSFQYLYPLHALAYYRAVWRSAYLRPFRAVYYDIRCCGIAMVPWIVFRTAFSWLSFTGSLSFSVPADLRRGMIELLSKTWKDRIWTLQEVLLCRNPILCCGTKIISWRDFTHIITWMELNEDCQKIPRHLPPGDGSGLQWPRLVRLWAGFHSNQQQGLHTSTYKSKESSLANYAKFVRKADTITIYTLFGTHVTTVHFIGAVILFVLAQSNVDMEVPAFFCFLGDVLYIILLILSLMWQLDKADLVPDSMVSRGDMVRAAMLPNSIASRGELIDEIILRRATDPRDKAYGLWGILESQGTQPPTPDSTKSLQEIYQDPYMLLSEWPRAGRLLFYANPNTLQTNRPSWVPDLEHSHQAWRQPCIQLDERFIKPDTEFNPKFSITSEGSRLNVQSLAIGNISWVSECFYEHLCTPYDAATLDSNLHNIQQIREPWRQFWHNFEKIPITHQTGRDKIERHARWRQEVLFSVIDEKKFDWLHDMTFSSWLSLMRLRPGRDTCPNQTILQQIQAEPDVMEFHAQICDNLASERRRLFLCNSEGRLRIGNGPHGLRLCDKVVRITRTHNDPLLAIRYEPTRQCYQVIGAVYLDNFFPSDKTIPDVTHDNLSYA
ncbi:hypothetical protein EV356DRAFT_569951, partial [Viridothelium virens]